MLFRQMQNTIFLEDSSTGISLGYITYKVKNTSTGKYTLTDGRIGIGFGDLSGFNPNP